MTMFVTMDLEWIKNVYDNSLSQDEYGELIGLEYVLTHGYSDDLTKDGERYRELLERDQYKDLIDNNYNKPI